MLNSVSHVLLPISFPPPSLPPTHPPQLLDVQSLCVGLCGRPLSFLVTPWLLSSYLCSLLTVPVSATAKDMSDSTDSLDSALVYPIPTTVLLLSRLPSGNVPVLSVPLANAHMFVTLQQPRTLGHKHRDSRCEGTCSWAICVRRGLLTSSVLLVMPTNFWHRLQHSSNAMHWPLQPYRSLRRAIGCAGEEIIWVFKT